MEVLRVNIKPLKRRRGKRGRRSEGSPGSPGVDRGSSSASNDPCPVVSSSSNISYSPYSPRPIWCPRYFAGIFIPPSERSFANMNFSNNGNRQGNLQLQKDSIYGWKPTEDFSKIEEQFVHDMKILNDNVQSENMCPDEEHDIFLNALRRLSTDYVQGLLNEREFLKNVGADSRKLKENCDFILERLNDMINVCRIANGAIGISEIQQNALCSSEKVLEGIKSQLSESDVRIEYSSASPPLEVTFPAYDQELEEAKKEVVMLLEQLAGTQDELEKVRKEFKDQIDVKQKDQDAQLLEIRASMIEKSQCSENLKETFAKRIATEEILFDIKWLIKDKIQFKGEEKREKVPEIGHSSNVINVTDQNEVHLVTMIATFLRSVSFPVTLDYIYTFVSNLDNAISCQQVENLLKRYPTFFIEETCGAVKKYSYLELKPIITI